jgi:hypothetical protein
MEAVINGLGILRRFGQRVGPYLMLEILLPGGTLLALLLFVYRRRKLNTGSVVPDAALSLTDAFATSVRQGISRLRSSAVSALCRPSILSPTARRDRPAI